MDDAQALDRRRAGQPVRRGRVQLAGRRAPAGGPAGPSGRASTPATARASATAPVRPKASQETVPPAPRVTVTRLRTPDGSVITVATFHGR